MVSKEEIERISKLMRIELDDHAVLIEKVQKMIEYFDILDNAGVETEDIDVKEVPISVLREDRYIKYNEKLIDRLKNYKGNYVRAPKMS